MYESEKKFIDPDADNFEQEVAGEMFLPLTCDITSRCFPSSRSGMATGVCNVSLTNGLPCDVASMTALIRHADRDAMIC